MGARTVKIAVTVLLILTFKFNISNELVIPISQNVNEHKTLNKYNKNDVNTHEQYVTGDEGMDSDLETAYIPKYYGETFQSDKEYNTDNPKSDISGPPTIGTKRIFKDYPEYGDLGAYNIRTNWKSKAPNKKRVRRQMEGDDDIIIWDYCEGKTHLEFTDGKFQCVEVTVDTRNSFGSLVNCPNNTRRVILRGRVVLCRPKKRRH